MPSALTFTKFLGTTTLGLMTGISYTLSTLTYPTLLTLPSASLALATHSTLVRNSTTHLQLLSALSTLSLGSAYLLSPKSIRHPYLLWTALVAAGSNLPDLFAVVAGKANEQSHEDEGSVNGEMVERDVVASQKREGSRVLISAVGFVLAVVGIWGDGA
ncbi:hypothetical protein MBLNU457_4791t1 [Dothideomycetes sp. NU457]